MCIKQFIYVKSETILKMYTAHQTNEMNEDTL